MGCILSKPAVCRSSARPGWFTHSLLVADAGPQGVPRPGNSPRRDSGSASSHWRGSDGLVFNAPGEASAFLRERIILLGQDGQTFCSKSFIGPNVAARKSTGRSSGSPSHINIILKSNSGLFYREIQEKMRNLAIFTRASLLFTRHHRGFYSDCCTCAHGANALTLAPSDQLPGWCDLSPIGGSHVHNMAFLSA